MHGGLIYNPETQIWERRSNERLKQLYGKESIVQFIKRSRLEWAGHVWKTNNSLIKTVLVNNINRKRPRGSLKQRWLDVIKRDIVEPRPDWNRDLNYTYNREEWKKLILAAKNLNSLCFKKKILIQFFDVNRLIV